MTLLLPISPAAQSTIRAVGSLAATALLVAVAYYAGANLGFMLRLPAATPSVLWPPNTILTAALLLSPPRRWWLYLLAALPAHLAAELSIAWPLPLVLALFATNCSQALIAAVGIRLFSDAPARFDTLRRLVVFILAAGLAAPFLSSFLDAAAVTMVLGEPYWQVWRTRFFSNVLTELVLGPAIVMAFTVGPAWIRGAPRARRAEAASLMTALALMAGWAFGLLGEGPGVIPGESVAILLLPLILLATVRFGPGGASLALLTTSVIAIEASAHGRGPFASMPLTDAELVLQLQVLLTTVAIPILCLAAVIVERRQAARAVGERLLLEVLLSRLSSSFVRLQGSEMDPAFEDSVRQVGEAAEVDRVVLCCKLRGHRRGPGNVWTVPGSGRGLAVFSEEHFPWTTERLYREQYVVFSRLEDLPDAAVGDVESFRRHGIRSGLVVPLIWGEQVHGAVGLFTVSTQRTWGVGLVHWLELAAEMFANALARKEAEDALRASEQSKAAILASLSSSVALLDRKGLIIDVNASWTRAMTEPRALAPATLAAGTNFLDAFRPAGDGMPHAPEALAGIVGVLSGERSEFAIEYPSRGGAGERWFLMSVVPIDRPEGGAVVSCTEITERKRAELEAQRTWRELTHFARVSTLGQLTASLAHELNQPLTGILTNARAGLRFLQTVPPAVGELPGILTDIVEDNERAGGVIRRLSDLLRKGEPRAVPRARLDLNLLVQDVISLLTSDAIIRKVTVTLDLAPEPVLVYGDRIELQQVLLNLLLNAMEAMAEVRSGERAIVVRTENTASATVHVAVSDRGTGFRADNRDQLFEPFFTTKPGGMGMGLSIARSIIEAHHGTIWATDNPGGGAVFHFTLPACPTDPR